jgi:hypothetical protein
MLLVGHGMYKPAVAMRRLVNWAFSAMLSFAVVVLTGWCQLGKHVLAILYFGL